MKILVTAFDPFGENDVNASWEALQRLTAPEGMELCKLQVPTVFGLAAQTVLDAVEKEKPDFVLCLGQAAGRTAVTPERVAINVRDASIPDNAGMQPQDEPIEPEGPAAYFSTLPIKAMVEAAMRAGVSAAVSNTAGTFVCNDLMYGLLHGLQKAHPEIRGGFVHVPACAAPKADPQLPAMPLAEIIKALEAMLTAL